MSWRWPDATPAPGVTQDRALDLLHSSLSPWHGLWLMHGCSRGSPTGAAPTELRHERGSEPLQEAGIKTEENF